MANLQIRNVDEEVIETLWLQAENLGLPIEQHLRDILNAAAASIENNRDECDEK
ncbi:MAG: hypothetical protein H7839_03815 [Magnetococcus sp. YQC-5]